MPELRRAHVPVALLVGVLITQLIWAWSTPPFRGIDEIDHVFRSASVARGDLRPTQLPQDGRGALVEVPPGLAAAARRQCQALEYNGPSNCVPEQTLPNGDVLIASSAAAYSPVVYAFLGTVARPWDGVTALYVMRATSSVLNALLIAAAAWCLVKASRSAWPLTGLVLALTPMAVYTTMIPAPNGVELSSAIVLWCSLFGLQRAAPGIRGRLLVCTGVAGALLGSVRLTGPIFLILIVGIVASSDPRRTMAVVKSSWRGLASVAVAVLLATLYQVHWVLTQPAVSAISDRRPFDLGVIAGQVLLWVFQWMGAFPLRGNPASPLTYLACGVAFVVVFVEGLRRGDRRRWLALGIVALALLLPLVFTLETFAEKGTFWQGRYALPLVVGAPILLGFALDRRHPDRALIQQVVVVMGWVATSAGTVHLVHLELARAASADDPHWHAPQTALLVILAGLAAVAFATALRGVRVPATEGASAEREAARAGIQDG